MNAQLFLNNFDSQFIAAVKSTPTTGTPASELDYGIVRLPQSAGALLGTLTNGDYYILTAFKRSGSNETSVEIMKVTSVDTSAINETRLTVLRGQEGTDPQAYISGDYISLRETAAGLSGMLQKSGNLAGLSDTAAARTNLGLGTTSTLNVPASGDAAAGEVVKGSDTRLVNARTPTAHNHAASMISDSSAVGRSVLTATDAAAARSALGAAPVASPSFTGTSSFGGAVRSTRTAVAALNIDCSAGDVFTKTITAISTFTVSNVPAAGVVSSFILDLTNGGAYAITWWTGVKWAGGVAPTLTAAGRDVLGFLTHDGGTTWTGLVLAKDVK
jgi:hypothetical protein